MRSAAIRADHRGLVEDTNARPLSDFDAKRSGVRRFGVEVRNRLLKPRKDFINARDGFLR